MKDVEKFKRELHNWLINEQGFKYQEAVDFVKCPIIWHEICSPDCKHGVEVKISPIEERLSQEEFNNLCDKLVKEYDARANPKFIYTNCPGCHKNNYTLLIDGGPACERCHHVLFEK